MPSPSIAGTTGSGITTKKLLYPGLLVLLLWSYENTMPNKTCEIRQLYIQQSQYQVEPVEPPQPPLLQWPDSSYFEKLRPGAELLQRCLAQEIEAGKGSVADEVFGNQKEHEYTGMKHLVNLLAERSVLYRQHLYDIDHRHLQAQEELFGVRINFGPDPAQRLTAPEGQLLQLEQQRREEELAFWKDTVELREKLFEAAGAYKTSKHRYSIFSAVEGKHGS
jgi:hypothetical protein